MRILLTGATGFLGVPLCRALQQDGHELTVLSRDPEVARARSPALRTVHAWDATRPPPPEVFRGVAAVVHLAGEPVAGRWTAAKRRRIRDSRVDSTRALVEGLATRPAGERPRVLISASAVGYYGDRGETPLDEEAPAGAGFLAEVCRAWEDEAARAEALGLRVVCLRFGLVLGPGGGALGRMLPLFRLGLGGPLGSGRQWWSWVQREDALGLIRFALEREALRGPVNVVSPEPVRQRAFARALGRALRRPALLPTPAWALRLALGGFARELLASLRVQPRQALAAGYAFRYPELEAALAACLSERYTPAGR